MESCEMGMDSCEMGLDSFEICMDSYEMNIKERLTKERRGKKLDLV